MFFCSRDAERDCIDLHRSVLTPLASIGNGGKLYVYKMSSGFWTQVKNAGLALRRLNAHMYITIICVHLTLTHTHIHCISMRNHTHTTNYISYMDLHKSMYMYMYICTYMYSSWSWGWMWLLDSNWINVNNSYIYIILAMCTWFIRFINTLCNIHAWSNKIVIYIAQTGMYTCIRMLHCSHIYNLFLYVEHCVNWNCPPAGMQSMPTVSICLSLKSATQLI